MSERHRLRVRGTVQGVGFRPFVYQQAVALGLSGWVGNDGEGVLLEVEGAPEDLASLTDAIRHRPPPLALVEAIEVCSLPPTAEPGFRIAASRPTGSTDVPVSADVAPCDACLTELRDPADRRHGYAFINCTDCGPRYTIVRDVPYDRPRTTMASFAMCVDCRREYDDPASRRFHAQPIACPECGPQLAWRSPVDQRSGSAALEAAVVSMRAGGVIALKGVGGYHLACDATDSAAVTSLRRRKRRDEKPFAVMVGRLADADELCELSPSARAMLESLRRPIVLAPYRSRTAIAAGVAPGLSELGVMLPSSPLHVLLLDQMARPLVMTSGNLTDEPVAFDDDEAVTRLWPIADGILLHNRPIHVRADDSVVRSTATGGLQVLRRARGWVPQPIRSPVPVQQPVLAVGAQLKSTVALARGSSIVVSHHLGDLGHWSAYGAFLQAVEHLTRMSHGSAAVIAHDLHPDYRSTSWALESGLPLLAVQHHHAHIASCLVEHARTAPVLGIAFDGAGLGPDGTMWGGELLLADLGGFQRLGHLATAPLPGGDAAVREPWRMALSWLATAAGPEAALRWGSGADPRSAAVLGLVTSGRSILTSSIGRLFDAMASLLGVRMTVSYEGQAAVELESLARGSSDWTSPYPTEEQSGILDPGPTIRALLADQARGVPIETMAARFHLGLAAGTAELAARLASAAGLDTVVLTGGVFQNFLLTDLLAQRLRSNGLRVLTHERIPPNDGGISVGQAAVAAAQLNTG